ncbi:MAG: PEP-CTERM sorting domain-containing protein [Planctomycetota bacterium]
MQSSKNITLAACTIASFTAISNAQFLTGGVWNRFVDWQGSDPAAEVSQADTWSYSFVDPSAGRSWFAEGGNNLTSRTDAITAEGVRISRDRQQITAGGPAPVTEWANPAGDGSVVDVSGKVRIQRPVNAQSGSLGSVELVVAKRAADGSVRKLSTIAVPATDLGSVATSPTIVPVDIASVKVNRGDSIIFATRMLGSDPGAVVEIVDDISISIDTPAETDNVDRMTGGVPILQGTIGRPSFSGGGSSGGGGGGTGLPPLFPFDEEIEEFAPEEFDSSDDPGNPDEPPANVVPAPGTVAALALAVAGVSSRRRR